MAFEGVTYLAGGIALIAIGAIVLAFAVDTAFDVWEWWTGR